MNQPTAPQSPAWSDRDLAHLAYIKAEAAPWGDWTPNPIDPDTIAQALEGSA